MSITRIFFFLCCPFLLLAQEEMTLEKAIAIGLENNYGIKISDTNIAIAENNDSWAVAGSGITLDLNGSFTNNLINNQNPASFCLLYTSPSPRDKRQSRMPSSA